MLAVATGRPTAVASAATRSGRSSVYVRLLPTKRMPLPGASGPGAGLAPASLSPHLAQARARKTNATRGFMRVSPPAGQLHSRLIEKVRSARTRHGGQGEALRR